MADGDEVIRFVHTADWHLGWMRTSLRDSDGMPVEYRWVIGAAEQMVNYVLSEGIGLVLMCGDILSTKNPSPTVENLLAGVLKKLTENGVVVVYLLGNHEMPARGDHPAKIYKTLEIPNVVVGDEVKVHRLKTYGGEVQVATIPASLPDESGFDEALSRVVGEIRDDVPSVLMAHIYTRGARLSGNDFGLPPDEMSVSTQSFLNLPFDYIALGHIHRYQQISKVIPAVYSGSIQRVTFAEEGETKGFVDVRIRRADKGYRADWRFVPVDSVRFITVEVDARGKEDVVKLVAGQMESSDVRGAMVRLRVRRRTDDVRIPVRTLRKLAGEWGAIAVFIEEKVEHTHREKSRDFEKTTGDMLLDIERYIKSEKPELTDRMREIIKTVREIING